MNSRSEYAANAALAAAVARANAATDRAAVSFEDDWLAEARANAAAGRTAYDADVRARYYAAQRNA
jgi:hypothetical protein